MPIKRIPIERLRVGMYVAGFDRSWLSTPFLRHRFPVQGPDQIDKLRRAGIRHVEIDTERGADAEDAAPMPAPPAFPGVPAGPSLPPVAASVGGAAESLAGPSVQERRAALRRELAEARQYRETMLREVRRLLSSLRESGAVRASQVAGVAQEIIEGTLGHERTLTALVQTRAFDPDLSEHALSVATLAVVLGRLLDYDPARLHELSIGALLHDVGFLALPASLNRPSRLLSESERRQFATHPLAGVDLLRTTGHFPAQSLIIVARHHAAMEAQPGSVDFGWQEAVENARLVQVVDRYDELLAGRGERPPMLSRDALRLLYQEGLADMLDPDLVSHLIAQVGIYPVCSFVELNTGQRGIVMEVRPKDLLHPVVLLTHAPDGSPYPDPRLVDFSVARSDGASIEICAVIDPEEAGVHLDAVLAG